MPEKIDLDGVVRTHDARIDGNPVAGVRRVRVVCVITQDQQPRLTAPLSGRAHAAKTQPDRGLA